MPNINLKPIKAKDVNELFELINSCRDYLKEWLPWVNSTQSSADTFIFIMENEDKTLFNGREVYIINYEGKICGMIDLHNGDRYNGKADIGYWLAEQYQGKGIITNACIKLIDKAFFEYNINRVTIKAAVGNFKSLNVAERLKFTKEGIERAGEFLNGRHVDLVVYSMLKKEWKTL